jgi:hypothetical protein
MLERPRRNDNSERGTERGFDLVVFVAALRNMAVAADLVDTSPALSYSRPTAPSPYSGSPPSMPSRAPLLAFARPDSNMDENLQNDACS